MQYNQQIWKEAIFLQGVVVGYCYTQILICPIKFNIKWGFPCEVDIYVSYLTLLCIGGGVDTKRESLI